MIPYDNFNISTLILFFHGLFQPVLPKIVKTSGNWQRTQKKEEKEKPVMTDAELDKTIDELAGGEVKI
jgi:hypothetical protein